MCSIEEAIQLGVERLGYQSLRDGQQEVIEAYINGKDVFFCSPTGSGKSLCYEIAPYVFDFVLFGNNAIQDQDQFRTKSVCIVVSPLVSLMQDQVASLRKRGISAIHIGAETTLEAENDVKSGKYNLVFWSPEALLNRYRFLFRGQLKENLRAVFVDECHCIAKWDGSFRIDYTRLGELRSLLRKEVPFIALTATATESTKNLILKSLCMEDCVEILANPNRPNTRYAVATINISDLYSSFSWLIEQLDKHNVKTPKVVVFCRRKQHMRDLFELFTICLGNKAYMPGTLPKDDRSRLFAMYHKMTEKRVKRTIEEEFCKPNGSVRVLFCSIAFGMGINVRDIYLDIHLGPSGDLDDYLQETGRVGRDTSQMSHALLLKFKGCSASKNITNEMKNYIKNDTVCRREILLRAFGYTSGDSVLHACCDICARRCKCLCVCKQNDCTCSTRCEHNAYLSEMEKHILNVCQENVASQSNKKVNNVTQKRAARLRTLLFDYRSKLVSITHTSNSSNNVNLLTGIDVTTGYSKSLIDNIVKNINYIKDRQYLNDNFSFFSIEHVERTWEIIECILESNNSSDDENVTTSGEISLGTFHLHDSGSDDNSLSCEDSDCDLSITNGEEFSEESDD